MGSIPKTVSTVTGNDEIAVPPDQLTGNLKIIGDSGVTILGDASTNTLKVSGSGEGTVVRTLSDGTTLVLPSDTGNIGIIAGEGVSVVSGANILTISATDDFSWNDNATTTTMSVNNGYIITVGAQVLTLPATSAIGDSIEVLLKGGSSWQIAQGAGQNIIVNSGITTTGVGGSILTTGVGQAIRLTCVVPNLTWQTTSLIGNPTVT